MNTPTKWTRKTSRRLPTQVVNDKGRYRQQSGTEELPQAHTFIDPLGLRESSVHWCMPSIPSRTTLAAKFTISPCFIQTTDPCPRAALSLLQPESLSELERSLITPCVMLFPKYGAFSCPTAPEHFA